jgi:hypothetical protein
MENLEPARKCFRLVGGVLVERTVAEVHPAVTSNKEKIKSVIEQLRYWPIQFIRHPQLAIAAFVWLLVLLFNPERTIATNAPQQFEPRRKRENHPGVREHAQAERRPQHGAQLPPLFIHRIALILLQPGSSQQSAPPERQSQGILAGKA